MRFGPLLKTLSVLTLRSPCWCPHQPRLIVTNVLPEHSHRETVHEQLVALQQRYGVPPERVISVGRASAHGGARIALADLFGDTTDPVVPPHRVYSAFHYTTIYTARYGYKVSYHRYCAAEERLFRVLNGLLHDARARPYLVVLDDDAWMHDESVFGFFTRGEMRSVRRVLQEDVDESTPGSHAERPAFVEEVVYHWDSRRHPFV